jgi:hypothetical protein
VVKLFQFDFKDLAKEAKEMDNNKETIWLLKKLEKSFSNPARSSESSETRTQAKSNYPQISSQGQASRKKKELVNALAPRVNKIKESYLACSQCHGSPEQFLLHQHHLHRKALALSCLD